MIGVPRRLVLVGSVIGDLILRVPRLPGRGGDVLGVASPIQPGGGFVVLSAAARLGLPVALLGLVGAGNVADRVRAALAAEGVPVLLPPGRSDTGICIGMVEPDGERTFVTSPGVEARLEPRHLASYRPEPGDVLYLSGYDLAYPVSGEAIGAWLPGCGQPLVFDPGPIVDSIPAQRLSVVLAATSVLTLNARELAILGDRLDPAVAWDDVARRLPADAAVLARDGAAGCTVVLGGSPQRVAAIPVTALDATGAGDTHTGATLAALGRGLGLVEAVAVGDAAAAFSVARAGSATGPTAAELRAFAPGLW